MTPFLVHARRLKSCHIKITDKEMPTPRKHNYDSPQLDETTRKHSKMGDRTLLHSRKENDICRRMCPVNGTATAAFIDGAKRGLPVTFS